MSSTFAVTPRCIPLYMKAGIFCAWTTLDVTGFTDALSDDSEEAAVCYLQALLADVLEGYSRGETVSGHGRLGLQLPPGFGQGVGLGDAADSKLWLERYAVATSDSAEIARREG